MYRTRQHWIVIFSRSFLPWTLAIACALYFGNQHFGHPTHLPPPFADMAGTWNAISHMTLTRYSKPILWILVVQFALNGFFWIQSWVTIGNGFLTYRRSILQEDRFPIYQVQEYEIRQSLLGLLLGYGTLVVVSGFAVQVVPFVPRIAKARDAVAALTE